MTGYSRGKLIFWILYKHSTAFSDRYIISKHIDGKATEDYMSSNSVEILRDNMKNQGLTILHKNSIDDTGVIECWF